MFNSENSLIEKEKFKDINLRILTAKYHILSESVDQISNAKSMEDKYKREIERLQESLDANLVKVQEYALENKALQQNFDS